MREDWRAKLGAAVDGSSIAFLRIALGLLMLYKAWALLAGGELEAFYTGSDAGWLAPYPGFGWLHAIPRAWLEPAAWALSAGGLWLASGYAARAAAALTCALWSLFWLYDATHWNNHFYLYTLLLGVLAFVPKRGDFVPRYGLWLLRAQLFVLYFFGGIAKLNTEWIVHAEPMRTVLASPGALSGFDALGIPESLTQAAGFAYAMSWGGLLFDLLAGFGLLWRPTRLATFIIGLGFHGLNHGVLFDDIGTFPAMGVVAMTIFFEPDWPRRLASKLRGLQPRALEFPSWAPLSRAGLIGIGLFALLQLLLPLRHYAIPGAVNWTLEGARFGWRMKAVSKAVGPFTINIDDAELGIIERQRMPTLFDLSRAEPDWEAAPAQVMILEAFSGTRAMLNLRNGGGAFANSGCTPADEVLAAIVTATHSDEHSWARALRLRELWQDGAASNPLAFRGHLATLAADARFGEAVREALRRAPPFFSHGMRAPEALRCAAAGVVPSGPAFARLGDMPYEFGSYLPHAVRVIDERGEHIRWNADRELGLRQRRAIQAWPSLLHAYVQHVAVRWEERFGRRPRIHVDDFVALYPYDLQRQIDPAVDLASSPLPWFGHAPWILPLDRSVQPRS